MNSISSAAPCHVRFADGTTYDVVAWVMLENPTLRPTGVIIRNEYPRYVVASEATYHAGPAPKDGE